MSTNQTKSIYTYNFIKFYNENIKNINNINNLNYNGYYLTNTLNNNHFLIHDYHIGVKKYYKENGYFTYTDNDNCKFLIGKMECNETTLKNNNLFLEY